MSPIKMHSKIHEHQIYELMHHIVSVWHQTDRCTPNTNLKHILFRVIHFIHMKE